MGRRPGRSVHGPGGAEEYGRRNGVPGELLVRVRPTHIVAVADMAGSDAADRVASGRTVRQSAGAWRRAPRAGSTVAEQEGARTMILERFKMDGKVAIVTGAGRGIGAATAVGLAQAGADVVISARTTEQLAQVADEIQAAGRRAVVVPADLSDLDAVAGLVDHARDAFGRLDLVVNNVGGAMPRPFMDTSPGRLEQAFHFNVSTAHALLRPAVPLMLEGDGGSVVNISSAMGRMAGTGLPGLRHGQGRPGPLHPARRRRPGPPHPGQRHRRGLGGHLGPRHRHADRRAAEALEAGTPLKRIGQPEDIAAAVVYLASEAGVVHHRKDPRGRRGHRGPQPRHGPARRMSRGPTMPPPRRPPASHHPQRNRSAP